MLVINRDRAMKFAITLTDMCDISVFEELGGRDMVVMTMYSMIVDHPEEIGDMLDSLESKGYSDGDVLIEEFDSIFSDTEDTHNYA